MRQLDSRTPLIVLLAAAVALGAALPASALPAPSRAADDQSLADREAELAKLHGVVADGRVAEVLAAHGFTQDEVNQRLAQLALDELLQLTGQIDQLQAGGYLPFSELQDWIFVLAVILILVLIASAL